MGFLGGARRVVRVPGWRKWNRGRKTATARVAKLQRQVNLLRPEPKENVVAIALPNVNDAAGGIQYMSAIVEGVNGNERIGNKIMMQRCNVLLNVGGTSASAGISMKVYLVRDLQSSGVVPVVSGTAQAIFTSFDPMAAFVNFFTKDRFKIMATWSFSDIMLNLGNGSSYRSSTIRLGTESHYHDATAAQTGAGKHAYYIVVLTQNGADTTDVSGAIEWVFTDV